MKAAAAGGVAWMLAVAVRLAHLEAWSLIDLLLMPAPLVIVPLGLSLVSLGDGVPTRLLRLASVLQPAGAAAALASFVAKPGTFAAGLATLWLVVCAVAALAGLLDLLERRSLHPIRLVPAAALVYLSVGAAWLVLSRSGWRPLGFSRVIVELTAVHFHHAGFAATVMAALAIGVIWGRTETRALRLGTAAVGLLLAAGSPITAAGFTLSWAPLQVAGPVFVATGVIGTAVVVFFWIAPSIRSRLARWLLWASSLSTLLPMVLAVEYSSGRVFGWPTLDIQGMAAVHGDLNALGFGLLGLTGWRLAQGASQEDAAGPVKTDWTRRQQ